ncbi:MAG: RNA polymerase subunit sigma-70, partial [Vicinamibacterales bacterium]
GRSKLAAGPTAVPPVRERRSDVTHLLDLYVARFNAQDWDGLRELIAADASLRVADRFTGTVAGSPYFGQYQRMSVPLRAARADIDGESAIALSTPVNGRWLLHSLIHVEVTDGRVTRIADYWHTPWMVHVADGLVVPPHPD